jgi:hypothetical protein
MSEEKAVNGAFEAFKTGTLLVPADPLANKARRGSIASIFEQATNQQFSTKNDSRLTPNEKNTLPVTVNAQAGNGSVLKSRVSAEKLKPLTKAAPAKRSRKRRKTLHDAETPQTSTRFAECLEVTQSRWVQDLEDPSREMVTLTGEVTSLDSETLDSSFRWIHYHREESSISFEDFEKVLDKDQGLYEDEVAVATKCIRASTPGTHPSYSRVCPVEILQIFPFSSPLGCRFTTAGYCAAGSKLRIHEFLKTIPTRWHIIFFGLLPCIAESVLTSSFRNRNASAELSREGSISSLRYIRYPMLWAQMLKESPSKLHSYLFPSSR